MTQPRDGGAPSVAPDEAMSLGARVRLAAGGFAIAALLLFFLQNLQEVRVRFLWFDLHTPLIFALFASAALGGIAAWLISALRRRASRSQGNHPK